WGEGAGNGFPGVQVHDGGPRGRVDDGTAVGVAGAGEVVELPTRFRPLLDAINAGGGLEDMARLLAGRQFEIAQVAAVGEARPVGQGWCVENRESRLELKRADVAAGAAVAIA